MNSLKGWSDIIQGTPSKRLIIAGCRHFWDMDLLRRAMFQLPNLRRTVTEIVSGGADGVDSLAKIYAKQECVPFKEFKANWSKHGRAAGPIRNQEMVDYAAKATEGVLVALWDRQSPGTRDCISRARKAELTVYVRIIEGWNESKPKREEKEKPNLRWSDVVNLGKW